MCFSSLDCYHEYVHAEQQVLRDDSDVCEDEIAIEGKTSRSYTYIHVLQREVLIALQTTSCRAAAKQYGIPRWTIRDWIKHKDSIFDFERSEKRKMQRVERQPIIPFAAELVTYMKTCVATKKRYVYPLSSFRQR
ncbi:Brinker DNA-binding domain [Phytophthora cactorum]|nr:Brinker DNA-binding domain [Phytophthora cactorum]